MTIRIPRDKRSISLKLNYENLILSLAVVYFLNSIYLVTTNETLAFILDVAQAAFLLGVGVVFTFQRVSRNNMLLRLLIIAVFAMSTLSSGVFPYLKYGLIMLAGIHSNWHRIYRRLFHLYFWGILLVVLLGGLGILPSDTVRRGYSTYGFVHSNILALYCLSTLSCFVLINQQCFRLKHYVASCIIIFTAWQLTDSRTALISMLFLMFLLIIGKKVPVIVARNSFGYFLALIFPVVLLFVSYQLGRNFNSDMPLISEIDLIVNGRLQMANKFMNVLSIPAFGQEVTMTLVENAYLTGLYHFGLIPTILELCVYIYAIKKSMDNRSYTCLACLLALALHGLAESATFDPFYNVALLSVFSVRKNTAA